MITQDDVLNFWFGDLQGPLDFPVEKSPLWFGKNEKVDQEIREKFLPDLDKAREGQCASWAAAPHGRLALIILLDQFSRNMFRDDPRSFAQDSVALGLAKEGLEKKQDRQLYPVERVFFYLPFEHSEARGDQATSVRLFYDLCENVPVQMKKPMREFLRFAEAHKKIIDRFGRFPHRNALLSRASTPEETEFLKQPGSSF